MATRAIRAFARVWRELSPSIPWGRVSGLRLTGAVRGSMRTALTRKPWRTSRSHWMPRPSRPCSRGSMAGAGTGLPVLSGGVATGRSITTRAGSPRVNTLVGFRPPATSNWRGALAWGAFVWGSLWALPKPRSSSWLRWAGLLWMLSSSRPSLVRTIAGPSRSSTTRRCPTWLAVRTWTSWAIGNCSRNSGPFLMASTPKACKRDATSTATSSSRLTWAPGPTVRGWPNHSRSRLPSGRLRLLTPS